MQLQSDDAVTNTEDGIDRDADRRPYVPNLDDYYAEIGEDRRVWLNEDEYR